MLAYFDLCEVIWIPESGKFFIVLSGILGVGIGNKGQGIRNPADDWNQGPAS